MWWYRWFKIRKWLHNLVHPQICDHECRSHKTGLPRDVSIKCQLPKGHPGPHAAFYQMFRQTYSECDQPHYSPAIDTLLIWGPYKNGIEQHTFSCPYVEINDYDKKKEQFLQSIWQEAYKKRGQP